MELRTAQKIKVKLAKDLVENLDLFFPYIAKKDGAKLSNPLSWKLNKKVCLTNLKRRLYDR